MTERRVRMNTDRLPATHRPMARSPRAARAHAPPRRIPMSTDNTETGRAAASSDTREDTDRGTPAGEAPGAAQTDTAEVTGALTRRSMLTRTGATLASGALLLRGSS